MNVKYMERAIELAKKGVGYVSPNPLVGAVLVRNHKIIGEGYHMFYGSHHAEINALENATENLKDSTLYVTLEPCSHFGKTPPCVDAILKKGIKEVIIGMKDPNPLVSGKGIQLLKNGGVSVKVGILEEQCIQLNEIFIKYITSNRPFCILKTAMTLDGKIASYTGDSKWITNALSRQHVHTLRHQLSSILVGVDTIIADDPLLTTRLEGVVGKDPLRIIADSTCRIPLNSKVLSVPSKAKTIIVTTERATIEKRKAIEATGAEILITPLKNNRVDLHCLCKILGERQIDSILLEGGSALNFSALKEGIVDKILAFLSPKILGGSTAKSPIGGEGYASLKEALVVRNLEIIKFGEDLLLQGYLPKKGVTSCLQD